MNDITVNVIKDTATPVLIDLKSALSGGEIKRAVGASCVRLTQDHLQQLGPNKYGFPTTRFYAGAARGTTWEPTAEGVTIQIDNADKPGAMRQRFHGGTIKMKDKMLTIPASAAFYGHSATEFSNLRLAVFGKSGKMALVVGKGGTSRINFRTGKNQRVKGAGAHNMGMIAYWLKEEVEQEGDPDVVPDNSAYADRAIDGVIDLLKSKGVLK